MAEIDSVIKLATEYSTKAISERVIRLDRLIISLNKIIRSLNAGAVNPQPPQVVHLQNIENIFFHDPQLFDDALMDTFFMLKDDLDSGARVLPLSGAEYQTYFTDILDKVTKKRNHQRIVARVASGIVWTVIVVVFVWLAIVGTAIAKSKWNELYGTALVTNQPSDINQRGHPDTARVHPTDESDSAIVEQTDGAKQGN